METEKRRLIDANLLIGTCEEIAKHEWNKKTAPVSWSDAYEGFIDTIEEMPTVDAVEVVRCKDCKHREDVLCPMESVEQYPWFATKNEGFCSYGERRTDV